MLFDLKAPHLFILHNGNHWNVRSNVVLNTGDKFSNVTAHIHILHIHRHISIHNVIVFHLQ